MMRQMRRLGMRTFEVMMFVVVFIALGWLAAVLWKG